jgi:hypothetical protein
MMRGIRRGPSIIVLGLMVFFAAGAAPAWADRVDDLAAQLSSSSEKTRETAVVSLARLEDKRALKPLVGALHDPSALVRALAATALGHLGHKAALPALRTAATDDTDDTVRNKARDAAQKVAKLNKLPDELPPQHGEAAQARRSTGFGRSPHAVEDRPDLYIVIKSTNDDSPGKADKTTRKVHADILKAALADSFKQAPQVTMIESEAKRWGLDARHLDLSVVKIDVDQSGSYVEIEAELRLAISDDTGKMLSFLSGGAKVQVPRTKFKPQFLPDLRKEALEGAMKGMFDKLLAHLRDTSQS